MQCALGATLKHSIRNFRPTTASNSLGPKTQVFQIENLENISMNTVCVYKFKYQICSKPSISTSFESLPGTLFFILKPQNKLCTNYNHLYTRIRSWLQHHMLSKEKETGRSASRTYHCTSRRNRTVSNSPFIHPLDFLPVLGQ